MQRTFSHSRQLNNIMKLEWLNIIERIYSHKIDTYNNIFMFCLMFIQILWWFFFRDKKRMHRVQVCSRHAKRSVRVTEHHKWKRFIFRFILFTFLFLFTYLRKRMKITQPSCTCDVKEKWQWRGCHFVCVQHWSYDKTYSLWMLVISQKCTSSLQQTFQIVWFFSPSHFSTEIH